jgi:hypothetical protein
MVEILAKVLANAGDPRFIPLATALINNPETSPEFKHSLKKVLKPLLESTPNENNLRVP